MKKVMKYIFKGIIFISIFFIILNYITVYLSSQIKYENFCWGNDLSEFYKIEENSLDMIFLGSSHCFCCFSPSVVEEVSGLKSYNLGSAEQPIIINYFWIKEALKTQSPKYIVLDVYMASIEEDEYTKDRMLAYSLDKMKWSKNKIDAINSYISDWKERIYNYIPLMKYHYGYQQILSSTEDQYTILSEDRGFVSLPANGTEKIENEKYLLDAKKLNISEQNEEYLYKIIELAKEENIKLIFTVVPFQLKEVYTEKLNYVKEIAINNDIEYIDFNELYYEIGLDYKTDFFGSTHLSRKRCRKSN